MTLAVFEKWTAGRQELANRGVTVFQTKPESRSRRLAGGRGGGGGGVVVTHFTKGRLRRPLISAII